jgi:IS5 family transposase
LCCGEQRSLAQLRCQCPGVVLHVETSAGRTAPPRGPVAVVAVELIDRVDRVIRAGGIRSGRVPGMSPARHASDDEMDAATWCRHLVPEGSVYAFLADHRHQLFPAEAFADLTRQGRGHPSVPAEVVASVMVLQALEGLSDREAASALRRDIAWKVACGLRLDDEGFHPTVLVYWRNRIRCSPRPRRIFEAVRQVVEATGVLRGRGRRVLDSTILADAVATQDTVTQLVAAIRRVRRLVPQAREVEVGTHDYDRPGKPDCAWDDPDAKQALVSGLVNDALAVLAAVQDVELGAEQAEAVALLALVAGQDVEAGQRPGSWRVARRVARDRVISTVDPQARHIRKTSAHKRDGYKAHVAAEPESGLFTGCALTAANAPDGPTGVQLLDDEEPGLEVLGDSAYGSGETRAALRAAKHTQTIKPGPLTSAVPGGFTKHDFTIDQQAGTVGCPAGYRAGITASGQASFGRRCQRCPLRQRCTTATGGRTVHVHPHEDELRAARRHATTRAFTDSYRRWRPMVERSIAWLVADGCRRVPYHGVERNHVWLSVRVAALNLRRLLTLGLARRDDAWVLA